MRTDSMLIAIMSLCVAEMHHACLPKAYVYHAYQLVPYYPVTFGRLIISHPYIVAAT
jgi:predicted transcriptional regulator